MIGGNLEFAIGKILWEMMWKIVVGKCCGQILWEMLQEVAVGKSCRKFLWENLVGKSCGTGRKGKSQIKKGSDWWKFNIYNRMMRSQPIRIQLGKILWQNFAGNSCGKILQEIVAGNSAGNFCGKILWDREEGKKPN